jgi:hypothetical protein
MISDVNTDLPGLEGLLKQKQGLRQLWQETMDPACKTAVKWATKANTQMTRRRALERKISNPDATPQAIWPIVKSLMKRDGPRKLTAIHGPFGLSFLPLERAKATADCLENQFIPHDLCDENNKWRVEAHALLEAVDNNPPERIRPCDLLKLVNSLKPRNACRIDGIPNECLRHFPRSPLVHQLI